MAARRPLSARNTDIPPRAKGQKPGKKDRYPFNILSRSVLVDNLKQVLAQAPPSMRVSLTEDDLKAPTAEKVQSLYLACMNAVFGVSPDAFKLSSFERRPVEFPELLEDATTNVQFFYSTRKFMHTCLVQDFRFTDIFEPDARRTVRNFSAIINFMKFHYACYTTAGRIEELQAAADEANKEFYDAFQKKTELSEHCAELQRQRKEEYELEKELKEKIAIQVQESQTLRAKQTSLEKHFQAVNDCMIKKNKKLAEVTKEHEKWIKRIEDLSRQVVPSPEKLRAEVAQVRQELDEMNAGVRDQEIRLREWESLTAKAQQIPPVVKSLNEDLDILMETVQHRDKLRARLDEIQDNISRQKQSLREATSKHHNLVRHMKLIDDEVAQLGFEEMRPQASCSEGLRRDLLLLEEECRQKESADARIFREIDAQKELLHETRAKYEAACKELDELVDALKVAYEKQREEAESVYAELDRLQLADD